MEGDESAVSPEAREQLFQILREAVCNALAHSGCERLAVRLRITGEEAIGVVEDDGRGFGPEEDRQEGPGGLEVMAERAALVGGTCRIGSSPLGGYGSDDRSATPEAHLWFVTADFRELVYHALG